MTCGKTSFTYPNLIGWHVSGKCSLKLVAHLSQQTAVKLLVLLDSSKTSKGLLFSWLCADMGVFLYLFLINVIPLPGQFQSRPDGMFLKLAFVDKIPLIFLPLVSHRSTISKTKQNVHFPGLKFPYIEAYVTRCLLRLIAHVNALLSFVHSELF